MKATYPLILIAALLFSGCQTPTATQPPATEHHAISPVHFWFDYPWQPSPGKRYWTAVGQTWIEQYENGDYSRFEVVSHTTIKEIAGTLAVKISGDPAKSETGIQGSFQAFIPDVGSKEMQFWFRKKINGTWQEWRSLAEMQGVE